MWQTPTPFSVNKSKESSHKSQKFDNKNVSEYRQKTFSSYFRWSKQNPLSEKTIFQLQPTLRNLFVSVKKIICFTIPEDWNWRTHRNNNSWKKEFPNPHNQFFRLGDGQIDFNWKLPLLKKTRSAPTLQKPENHATHHMTPDCHDPRHTVASNSDLANVVAAGQDKIACFKISKLVAPSDSECEAPGVSSFFNNSQESHHLKRTNDRPLHRLKPPVWPRGPTNSGYVRSFLQPSNAAPINRAETCRPLRTTEITDDLQLSHLQDLDRQIHVPDHVLLRDKCSHCLSTAKPLLPKTLPCRKLFVDDGQTICPTRQEPCHPGLGCTSLRRRGTTRVQFSRSDTNRVIVFHRGSERIAVFVRGRSFSRECVAFATTDCPNMKIWHRWDPPIERLLFLERLLQLGIDKTKRAPKIPKTLLVGRTLPAGSVTCPITSLVSDLSDSKHGCSCRCNAPTCSFEESDVYQFEDTHSHGIQMEIAMVGPRCRSNGGGRNGTVFHATGSTRQWRSLIECIALSQVHDLHESVAHSNGNPLLPRTLASRWSPSETSWRPKSNENPRRFRQLRTPPNSGLIGSAFVSTGTSQTLWLSTYATSGCMQSAQVALETCQTCASWHSAKPSVTCRGWHSETRNFFLETHTSTRTTKRTVCRPPADSPLCCCFAKYSKRNQKFDLVHFKRCCRLNVKLFCNNQLPTPHDANLTVSLELHWPCQCGESCQTAENRLHSDDLLQRAHLSIATFIVAICLELRHCSDKNQGPRKTIIMTVPESHLLTKNAKSNSTCTNREEMTSFEPPHTHENNIFQHSSNLICRIATWHVFTQIWNKLQHACSNQVDLPIRTASTSSFPEPHEQPLRTLACQWPTPSLFEVSTLFMHQHCTLVSMKSSVARELPNDASPPPFNVSVTQRFWRALETNHFRFRFRERHLWWAFDGVSSLCRTLSSFGPPSAGFQTLLDMTRDVRQLVNPWDNGVRTRWALASAQKASKRRFSLWRHCWTHRFDLFCPKFSKPRASWWRVHKAALGTPASRWLIERFFLRVLDHAPMREIWVFWNLSLCP